MMEELPGKQEQGYLKLRDSVEHLSCTRRIFRKIGTLIHPNHISAMRLPLGASAIALHSISHIAGASLFAVNALLDWVDGAVARVSGKRTYEGAVLDPLIDKVVTAATLWYLVAQNIENTTLVVAAMVNTVVDVAGQRERGPFHEQLTHCVHAIASPESCQKADEEIRKVQANVWGKLKFTLQTSILTGFLLSPESTALQYTVAGGMIAASALAVTSAVVRWWRK